MSTWWTGSTPGVRPGTAGVGRAPLALKLTAPRDGSRAGRGAQHEKTVFVLAANDLLVSQDAGMTFQTLVTETALADSTVQQSPPRFGSGSGGAGVRAVYISPASSTHVRSRGAARARIVRG